MHYKYHSVEMMFSTVFPVVEGFTEAICTFSTSTAGQIVASVSWWHNVTQPVSGEGGRVSKNKIKLPVLLSGLPQYDSTKTKLALGYMETSV